MLARVTAKTDDEELGTIVELYAYEFARAYGFPIARADFDALNVGDKVQLFLRRETGTLIGRRPGLDPVERLSIEFDTDG